MIRMMPSSNISVFISVGSRMSRFVKYVEVIGVGGIHGGC